MSTPANTNPHNNSHYDLSNHINSAAARGHTAPPILRPVF